MPIIRDTTTASLWLPTASLPAANPYGLTSSPDGSTLYVTCANGGSGGRVVAIDIATKAVTTIASGLAYARHGICVDSAGDLYWGSGPNENGDAVFRRWDGSTNTNLPITSMEGMGSTIDPAGNLVIQDRIPDARSRLVSRVPSTGATVYSQQFISDDRFMQTRGTEVTSEYVISADSLSNGRIYLNDINTGAPVSRTPADTEPLIGVAVWADDEVYVLGQGNKLIRFNPQTLGRETIATDLPSGGSSATGVYGAYGDIHITARRRCFVTRGGWAASRSSSNVFDGAKGTDAGIYEVETVRGGPWVGRLGIG